MSPTGRLKPHRHPSLLVCLACTFLACISPQPHTTPSATDITLGASLIRPAVRSERLDNGLEILMLPEAESPLVCLQVWVRVGSVDERAQGPGETHGLTGLSHFFEHLMFQGTDLYPNYDIALAELGGRNNAFTYQDATVYWSCASRDHLPRLIDIEADRFARIKVDFIHLEPEREVVKSERRQTVDADPGEFAEERAVALTFDRFPYQWGPIGWMSDLDSIPLEEAQRYHALHYTPDQTLVIVAGGFEPIQTLDTLRATWGLIKSPTRAPDYQTRSELQAITESWTGPREDHVLRTSAQPEVVWSYRAPAPSGPTLRDYAALELIDWALTGGKAGRLSGRLVFSEPPLISNLSARLTPLRYPYAYLWRVELLPTTHVSTVERIIDEEFTRIATDGLSLAELERAVASLRAEVVRSTLSLGDRAEAMGFSWSSTGTPFGLFDRLELYASLTSEDLKSAARRYLTPAMRTRVTIVSPDRLEALVHDIAEVDPNAAPLRPLLRGSMKLFLESLSLEKDELELARERRAIALLLSRAAKAKAQSNPEERSAIEAYMQGNEMGSTERESRLELSSSAHKARAASLEKARSAHLQSLERLATQSRARLASNPLLSLARALATDLETPLPRVPLPWSGTPPRHDLITVEQLVLQLLVATALDARGQALSAQHVLTWVIDNASRLLDSPLNQDLLSITRTTLELARDLQRRNLELIDAPIGGP